VADLQARIEELWDNRDAVKAGDKDATATVHEAIDLLDTGQARVAELIDGEPVVHTWLKQAILLLFKVSSMETLEVGPFEYADKLPLKKNYEAAGVRVVPGASARWGSHIEPGAILMPCYINIGARVGGESMIDTWATVASCAQVGSRTHISGGVGLGGVLEPPNAVPVMIGDDCMIGSRSMITQGARVGDGSVLGEGVLLNPTIPVYDAQTGEELSRGVVPPLCIAVQSWIPKRFPGGEFGRPCVLVVRRLEPGERAHLNDILREEGVST